MPGFVVFRDRDAKARVEVRIRRLSLGNPGQFRVLTNGIHALKIDCGPGCRVFLATPGDVARVRDITQLAANTGLTRMGLYKAASGTGNYSSATVSKVARAPGFKSTVAAA